MVTIFIDGVAYDVDGEHNLLKTALELGFNVPYFCWHPALHSVGACRQCAVKQFKDENDTKGKLVMSCMTPLTDGMHVSLADPEAQAFRASVIEWLMLNHPHDCPICDEGGECHLQDMTVMSGHNYRRNVFPKRTYISQDLGPFIHHEMNRCIQCYRCVRYYRDYAGGDDLQEFAGHDNVFFGRYKDGALESPHSGNLVEICPTGVFTDKTFKQHAVRKWDLQTAPAICTHCSLGCNITPGERYGTLRRIRNRYNGDVNGYFLCDRGRFGYEFVNDDKRIRKSVMRYGGSATETDAATAASKAGELVSAATRVIGIGSPRATLESNWALRDLVGEGNFYAGVSDRQEALTEQAVGMVRDGVLSGATLAEVEQADAVLVLGEDPVNTAPRLELALRQASRRAPIREAGERVHVPEWKDKALRVTVQDKRGPLFVASPYATSLDRIATDALRRAPADIARFGYAVAHELDEKMPEVSGLSDDEHQLALRVATALRNAEQPLLVSGTSLGSEEVLGAARAVAEALAGRKASARQFLVLPEYNSAGLALLEPRPFSEAIALAGRYRGEDGDGTSTVAVILENDLYRRESKDVVDGFLGNVRSIVIDHSDSRTAEKAEIVLAAATFAEGSGTAVNNEGRAQRSLRVADPSAEILDSWRWLRQLAGDTEAVLDSVIDALVADLPQFEGIKECAPPATARTGGRKVPRQMPRYSGRTSMHAARDVTDHQAPADEDTPMGYSMEGHHHAAPSSLMTDYWASGWNSVQALNRFQEEIAGPLRGGNPGVQLLSGNRAAGSGMASANRPAPAIPEAFSPRDGSLYMAPHYHIFGSEPTSARGRAVALRAEEPYVGISSRRAGELGVRGGEPLQVALEAAEGTSRTVTLPARVMPELPPDVGCLPVGLDDEYFTLPAWATISAANKGGSA